MLFSVLGAGMAFAVPMNTSEISFYQAENTLLTQAADAGFTARAPPMAVSNVAVTGGVTSMQGSAFTVHGQETVAALFGFGDDLNATNRTVETGARRGEIPYWDHEAAEAAYDVIRQTDDVAAIARNTGMREAQIQRIRDHLFNNTHILDEGRVARFDADPDIANAWVRLQGGRHTEADIQLLNHELFESRFEGIFRTDYRCAHCAANRSGRPSGLEQPTELE